uniref:Secreted protein n=1 Tax=Mesocestoides corti TaxID=53468 RepID=A0A5K3FPQ4_MESCO
MRRVAFVLWGACSHVGVSCNWGSLPYLQASTSFVSLDGFFGLWRRL